MLCADVIGVVPPLSLTVRVNETAPWVVGVPVIVPVEVFRVSPTGRGPNPPLALVSMPYV